MSDKKTAFTVRIDDDLLNNFKRVCEQNDYTLAFVIRELMKNYINLSEKQQDLFNRPIQSEKSV
jgi:predicted transcriptional regulator